MNGRKIVQGSVVRLAATNSQGKVKRLDKTIVAALDYRRLRDELGDLRLLFVAHRKELLGQSLSAFRQVLREGSFGELYVDGYRPKEWRHVFASVQSLA